MKFLLTSASGAIKEQEIEISDLTELLRLAKLNRGGVIVTQFEAETPEIKIYDSWVE